MANGARCDKIRVSPRLSGRALQGGPRMPPGCGGWCCVSWPASHPATERPEQEHKGDERNKAAGRPDSDQGIRQFGERQAGTPRKSRAENNAAARMAVTMRESMSSPAMSRAAALMLLMRSPPGFVREMKARGEDNPPERVPGPGPRRIQAAGEGEGAEIYGTPGTTRPRSLRSRSGRSPDTTRTPKL